MSADVKPWGCHSQPRKDGYWASEKTGTMKLDPFIDDFTRSIGLHRVQSAVWIEDTMSKDCKHRIDTPDDPRCEGCTSP